MAKRRTFTAAFKARVAKEALRGNRTACVEFNAAAVRRAVTIKQNFEAPGL